MRIHVPGDKATPVSAVKILTWRLGAIWEADRRQDRAIVSGLARCYLWHLAASVAVRSGDVQCFSASRRRCSSSSGSNELLFL